MYSLQAVSLVGETCPFGPSLGALHLPVCMFPWQYSTPYIEVNSALPSRPPPPLSQELVDQLNTMKSAERQRERDAASTSTISSELSQEAGSSSGGTVSGGTSVAAAGRGSAGGAAAVAGGSAGGAGGGSSGGAALLPTSDSVKAIGAAVAWDLDSSRPCGGEKFLMLHDRCVCGCGGG